MCSHTSLFVSHRALFEIVLTSKLFYLATFFLRFMTMLKEFATCMNLIKGINWVPTCGFADEMLLRNEDDKQFIVELTPVGIKHFGSQTGAHREVQRVLLELLEGQGVVAPARVPEHPGGLHRG